MKAGIVGASGYAGTELLRLLAGHPGIDVAVATADRRAGERVAEHTPSLAGAYGALVYDAVRTEVLEGLDVVFVALPHGESQLLVPDLLERSGVLVDLGADFRLRDAALYERWYGGPHGAPHLLGAAACGLPELFRQPLAGAALVAVPGCYPTAAALALAPFARAGLLGPDPVVVDAASGVSGAGRAPAGGLHFADVDEDFCAYGLLSHRHTPEMEAALGVPVLFTPHLAPMARGIFATCYARPARPTSTAEAMELLHDAYDTEPFVVVTEASPSTKSTLGSNTAHVTARVDDRTGYLLALGALDNLVKGAAGQAIQCANLALGLPEETGLPAAGVYP